MSDGPPRAPPPGGWPKRPRLLGVAHALVHGGERKWDAVLKLAKESVVGLVAIVALWVIHDLSQAVRALASQSAATEQRILHNLDEDRIDAAAERLSAKLHLSRAPGEAEREKEERTKKEQAEKRARRQFNRPAKFPSALPPMPPVPAPGRPEEKNP